MRHKTLCAKVTDKILRIIDDLVEEGDYLSRGQFVNEAIRGHLATWYPKMLEEKKE